MERFWEICLNSNMEAVGAFELASGGATFCVADVPSVVRNALLTGATNIVIAHNHPSGKIEPSADDDELTRRVRQAMDFMGLQLTDHIIVTRSDRYSYKESRRL